MPTILNSQDDIHFARSPMSHSDTPESTEAPADMRRRSYRPPPIASVRLLTAKDLLHGIRPLAAEHKQLDLAEVTLNAPLWCAGDTSLVERKAVAVVGTRGVSAEGAARTRRLARELTEAGITIVSGLARGVDTEALTSAINSGSKVIAVIGTPIDKAYPAENKKLQEEIYTNHLLISQFTPGSRVFPSHFPLRNRLMALLTDASVIVEAGETSGTLHQAAECVRLGRWLFIARSVVENPALSWPKTFISYEKCRVLTQTADILGAL